MKRIGLWALLFVVLAALCGLAQVEDTDRDGIPDEWEQAHGLDPYVEDSGLDPDRDGGSNSLEYRLGTDPQDASSRGSLAENWWKVVGYWPLETNAEAELGDQHGTLMGGAVFRDERLVLDGQDAFVSFGSSLSVTGSLSYCVWLRPETGRPLRRLLGKFEAKGQRREYCAFLGNDYRVWTFFSDDGSARNGHTLLKTTQEPALEENVWGHLAVTWDASMGSAGVTVYVNGTPRCLLDLQGSDLAALHSGPADLTLGGYDVERREGSGQREAVKHSFKGSLSRFVLCAAPLTALEVKEIFLLGPAGSLTAYLNRDFDGDGLLDWWEREFFGDIRPGAMEDSDGDGLSNIEEFGRDADPLVPDNPDPGRPRRFRTIHVDCALGDDRYSGFFATVRGKHGPKRTIAGGMTAAQNGDHIVIHSGTYRENANFCVKNVNVSFQGHVVIH